ncbi:unnamed protein product [Penicillium salamii]|uniref:DNA replication checkpoint mediator MRC1 domain-containing protein n=1 Tax=Penicillium salamii TaxID=1612424 RepID=A0A9W4ILT2_9EURO|nr:unnamed protein product [Penicillium salamii]CAG8073880.1 unnamed protein product [Penicillium salamii]CAG8247447.1 unnamed protein product [Penicillium salamii]CAG8248110.1 unnamed protein product [Penicillium salamii]CAG8299830.1 unnamed protein product [Penicillium salamii]
MSSPSTPHSTRSASPGDSPKIITPGQKIKALMAEFDSDSEEETQIAKSTSAVSKLNLCESISSKTSTNRLAHDSGSETEDDVARPKGRMAARMQGDKQTSPQSHNDSAIPHAPRTENAQATEERKLEVEVTTNESSDDDLPTAGPRRRTKAKSNSLEPEASQTPARSESPLFVSSPGEPDGESDNETNNTEKTKANDRFLSLVAKKRKEREDREKAEAEKKAARRSQMEHFSSEVLSGEESGAEDPGSAHKLSQKARQPRKASKKALDEMRQETQRMSRNMQLAHQAQTKKKITKESLFARFNFMQPEPPIGQAGANSSINNSQNTSDGDLRTQNKETPQTSPARLSDQTKANVDSENLPADMDVDDDDEDLSDLKDLITQVRQDRSDPSEVPIAKDSSNEANAAKPRPASTSTQRPFRVRISRQQIAERQKNDDSDEELEIVTSPGKCRRLAAFENLPTRQKQESPAMLKLKALAHLTNKKEGDSMSPAELSASLLRRARQQAVKERRERIEELRAKGVVIETAEERAAMEDDMENLVEKARKEAEEIARLERASKKKNNDDDDEDEDDDYQLSGSDDDDKNNVGQEGDEDDEDDEDENDSINGGEFVEQEADEDDDEDSDDVPSDAEVPSTRRKRPTRVISDDEDEEQVHVPSTPVKAPSHTSRSAERPKFPAGKGTPGDMSLGLTQAFASTLDGDAFGSQPGSATIPFTLPDPGQPTAQLRKEDSEILAPDSQPLVHEKDFADNYSQNVTRVSESPAPYAFSEYSQSQLPDPTQDEGFVFSPFDPAKRFRDTPPMSTVDTVLVGQTQSPVADRKRKMLRRGRANELPQFNEKEDDFEINPTAFDVMKKTKAKKKQAENYDKKNSKAKDIIDEAAEESEDEYAGLGGNSDESDGEENAMDQQMINDNSGEVVDEKQLAALNAVHDRNRDEKDVANLMRDITTGALRRRKNADDDLDLDDSDDEHLARRREKQREFAKMRRALLADEKIGEIAENPKKAAFFKAVEDREVEDDFNIDFLEEEQDGSQEMSQDVPSEGQSNDAENKLKRPLEQSTEDTTNRPPPHLRRTRPSAASKKPATLAEIRETLSFLTETPEYDSFREDASLDEGEHEEGEDTPSEGATEEDPGDNTFAKPSNPRRTRGVVVDRLALLRQASSNSANTNPGANSKVAFHNGGGEGPIGFRPPQLLRRVTTGSSSSSNSNSSNRVSKAPASGPKKGGAVNSYTAAREREREKELRIKERNSGSNIAKLLGKHTGGGLGALGKGQWD